MLDTFWQRLDSGARAATPFITALLCTLLGAVSWPLPWFGTVAPPLALMAVYYWAIHRPDLFRPGMAFTIGLLHDAIHFLPLGLSALLFVAAHQIIFRQRRFFSGHSFFVMWAGFALTAVIVTFFEWLLQGLIGWHRLPAGPVIMECLLAIILFPLPCWIMIRLQRVTLSQS